MTTFAALQDAERELEERTAAAWKGYRDDLCALEGAAYAAAETSAWDQLQTTLRELRQHRDGLAASGGTADGQA